MRLTIGILFLIGTVCSYTVSYEGYKVFTVVPTKEQLPVLHELEESERYDFWTPVRKDCFPVDIMVSPEDQPEFIAWLNAQHFEWSIKIENVQTLIDQENAQQKAVPTRQKHERISFDKYYSYDEIVDYLENLEERFPNIVSIDSFGNSTENRVLKAIRISKGGNNKRPLIFIDSGIHAREWISPAMALYIIDQLLENSDNSYMTENIDWIIVPVINPDGYKFTETSRMWRKTRSIFTSVNCPGTDANRNFDFHWNDGGSSSSPCSETYHGPSAFSEPETNSLIKYAEEYASRIKFYLSFHSYGKYVLYPWGFSYNLPEDDVLMRKVGEIGHKAINAVRGTKYTVGSTSEVLYIASGGSADYFKGPLDVQLSYTLELPGGGGSGFDLPAREIKGVVIETFEGVRAWYQYVSDNL